MAVDINPGARDLLAVGIKPGAGELPGRDGFKMAGAGALVLKFSQCRGINAYTVGA